MTTCPRRRAYACRRRLARSTTIPTLRLAASRGATPIRSGWLSLILHRSYDAFWMEFISGVAATCALKGKDLLLSMAETSEEADRGLQRLVRGRRVDGIVICDIRQVDPRIAYLREIGLPFVAFGRTAGAQNYPFVDVNGAAGMVQAVEHLAHLGHRRIAYLGLDSDFGFSHFRFDGYREALRRAGLDDEPALVYHDLTDEGVAPAVATLLAQPDPPTAIVAAADFLALATLGAVRAAGLRVPEDLSLVVFDDNPLVRHAVPPLTAISQPHRCLGEEVTTLLLDRVANAEIPVMQQLIVPTLNVRESTAPPPGVRAGRT